MDYPAITMEFVDLTVAGPYDSGGVRVSETTGTNTTTYLNDPNNPTGYTKAVEENSTSTGLRSYVLGLKVEGQLDAAHGTLFLITDGHGSTRELVDLTTGTIQQHYDYDAYGKVLGVTGLHATYWTTWLFSGDGVYDPASGWTYQLARWRDGFLFPSMDSFGGDPNSPASLHRYLYANGDPVNMGDPTGFFSLGEGVVGAGIQGGLFSMAIMSPFRIYKAARQLSQGASLRDATKSFFESELFDFGTGFWVERFLRLSQTHFDLGPRSRKARPAYCRK